MSQRSVSAQTERLRAWLDKATRRRAGMPTPQLLVRAPGLEFEHGDLSIPFHGASVGKLATATLIGQLVEEQRFGFGTPIGSLLGAGDLGGLPAASGVDPGHDITVKHLLAHTSGLPDYFEPPGRARTAASAQGAFAHPDRVWTPSDLLDEIRPLPAVGAPGERFHYSDTGYVLLGRIVEETLEQSFASALQSRIFEPAGMTQSSTPYDATVIPEDLATLDVAPLWLGKYELSRARCVSLDWAGGGIVATAKDFVSLQQALHSGNLMSREGVARMIRIRHRLRRGIHYGAGSMTLKFGEFFPLLRGLPQPTGHLGATATHLFYYPQHDAHVVLNFHSTEEMRRSFDAHIHIARLLSSRQ